MYQHLLIVGNLGNDPVMKILDDGTPVTTFSIATNKRWKNPDNGHQQEKTTWYRVTCWRRLAETTNELLSKGRQVLIISDDISTSPWIDDSGAARAELQVTARVVKFLNGTGHDTTGHINAVMEEASQDHPSF